jgi:hypothetical protein
MPAQVPDHAEAARTLPPLVDVLDDEERLHFTLLSRMSLRDVEAVTKAFNEFGIAVPVIHKTQAGTLLGQIGDKLVAAINGRRLDDLRLAAVTLDGTPVGRRVKHTMMIAVGITTDGVKVPLGIAEGPTETKELVRTLLDGIVERGLDTTDVLWVTDGGTALIGAVEELTERQGALQRCTVHLARKVIEHHLLVGDRVEIGRRHAAMTYKSHPSDPAVMERLAAIREEMAADPRDRGAVAAEQALLREIGEREVRSGLYRAWNAPDMATAEARLLGESKWLAEMGYESAANAVQGAIEGTTRLQRLGLGDDQELLRSLRQTNVMESINGETGALTDRPNAYTKDTPMRLRFTAVGVARAEGGWRRMAPGSRLERVPVRVMAARHPAVELEVALGEGGRAVLERAELIGGIYPDGAGGERLDAALADVTRWAQAHGKTVAIGEHVLDRAPDPEARRAALADHGFAPDAVSGALVRRPDGVARDPLAALGLVAAAAGGDARLVAAVAERAHVHVPALVDRPVAALEAAADAGLGDVAEVRGAVGAWWSGGGHEAAARHMALRAERARRAGVEAPDVLAGGRAAVLEERQADWLRGQAAVRGAQLREVADERLAAYEAEVAGAFAPVDAAARAVDGAARAVAATHVLDAHARIAAARGREGEVPEVVVEPSIDQHRSAIGDRRADAFDAAAAALGTLLAREEPATVARVHAGVGDPWSRLDAAAARAARGVEERDVPALVDRYCAALAERTTWDAQAQAARRGGRAELDAAAQRADGAAKQAWGELTQRRGELATLRAQDHSLDRFVTEQPGAALQQATGAELAQRGRVAELAAAPAIESSSAGLAIGP